MNRNGANVMHEVKLNKNELLRIVRENREKHIKEFEEAENDYRELVLKVTKENLKYAKTGDLKQFKNMKALPVAPTSYESSYDKAIRMLELSVEEVIEIDSSVFNQLVLDEWGWKQTFTTSNALYKSGI